jgi:allene oxide cyclase
MMKQVWVSLVLLLGFAFAEELHVVERVSNQSVTDTGETGDSVGDILTFSNEVYDDANEQKVGRDSGYCIRTIVGQQWDCYWTLYLDGGQIVVHGPFYDVGDSVMAIIGGTGEYAGAGGEMKLSARNSEATEYNFIYTITP